LGISHSTVARVWAEHDLKPWQTETFKFSTDPELEAKVRDVVGLYLEPPAHAIVLCVDEKSQIQALERTRPVRPVAPGRVERRTHDYVHNARPPCSPPLRWPLARSPTPAIRGTATVSFWPSSSWSPASIRAASCRSCWTTTPPTSTSESRPGWASIPACGFPSPPTYASWLNLVEVFFAIIQRQALRRGDFASVQELVTAIGRYCDGWNQRCPTVCLVQGRRSDPGHVQPSTHSAIVR
jgi:hypothetical protein